MAPPENENVGAALVAALYEALLEEGTVQEAPGGSRGPWGAIPSSSMSRDPIPRKVLDDFFLEDKVAVRVAMETENVEIIRAMVSHGLGVSIIPFAAAAKDVKAGASPTPVSGGANSIGRPGG